MHTIKLEVKDSFYANIMDILNNLNNKEVRIIGDKKKNTLGNLY